MELERNTGVEQSPCWCTRVDFSAELLSRIPPGSRSVACICPDCARRAAQA
jgi:hypothetical protein